MDIDILTLLIESLRELSRKSDSELYLMAQERATSDISEEKKKKRIEQMRKAKLGMEMLVRAMSPTGCIPWAPYHIWFDTMLDSLSNMVNTIDQDQTHNIYIFMVESRDLSINLLQRIHE